jgi:hypothetical protein
MPGLAAGLAVFLPWWTGLFTFQVVEVSNEAQEHGQSFSWSEFFP